MTYADVWNALDPHDAVWSNRGLNWPWMKNLLFDGGSCWVTALKDWSWWASLGHPSLLLPWPLSLPIHCWGHAPGTHCCLACWIGLWRGLYPVTSTQLLSTGTGCLAMLGWSFTTIHFMASLSLEGSLLLFVWRGQSSSFLLQGLQYSLAVFLVAFTLQELVPFSLCDGALLSARAWALGWYLGRRRPFSLAMLESCLLTVAWLGKRASILRAFTGVEEYWPVITPWIGTAAIPALRSPCWTLDCQVHRSAVGMATLCCRFFPVCPAMSEGCVSSPEIGVVSLNDRKTRESVKICLEGFNIISKSVRYLGSMFQSQGPFTANGFW